MTAIPSKFLRDRPTQSGRAPTGAAWRFGALCGVAFSVVACSSSTPVASTSPGTSVSSAADAAASSGRSAGVDSAGGDVAAACDAVLTLNAVQPPGTDPDGPAPTPQEMTAWVAAVQPALTIAAANAPPELTANFVTLQKTADAAKQGTPVDTSDPALSGALNTINASVHDNCGFQTLDVANSGGALAGVPATLDAGPLAIEFTNSTDPAAASFVLLVARIKDGQTVPLADIQSGKADLSQVSDVIAGLQPTGTDPAYSTATLTPGHYVVASPMGTPPAFSKIIGVELDVK